MDFLDRFEPKAVIKHFVNICNIPHPSGHEEGIREYIRKIADENGQEYFIDKGGNIIVYVEASPGNESLPPYLIQAHMDMVPAKEEWSNHDFLTDPISLKLVDNRYLYADGTTLGADNAVGMMYMLTLMEDKTVIHPPLELLFTTREEVGLQGIREVDFSKIKSRRMMNMDCGDPDVMCVSTAGAAQCMVKLPLKETELKGEVLELSIGGLLGGHGGLMIDSGRLSAIAAMGRVMSELHKKVTFNIVDARCKRFSGIPSEMKAVISVAEDKTEKASQVIAEIEKEICAEYADPEKDLFIRLKKCTEISYDKMMDDETSQRFWELLYLIPFGVTKRDYKEKETVLCSNNMVEVSIKDGFAHIEMMVRSPLDTVKQEVVDRIELIASLCGSEMILLDSFSGWPYRSDSPMQEPVSYTHLTLPTTERV